MRLTKYAFICVLALIFSAPAFADEVNLFTQPLSNFLINGNVPSAIEVGLALCVGCALNPLAGGIVIGPFGPITAQPVSETFTVGPSNPAFAPIVQALRGQPPTPPPPFFGFVPFVLAFENGNAQVLENGYGVGAPGEEVRVRPIGTIESLSIEVPEISKFEIEFGGNEWVAVGPDGKQVYASWEAEGVNLVPEPSAFALLACGISFVAGLLALAKLRRLSYFSSVSSRD